MGDHQTTITLGELRDRLNSGKLIKDIPDYQRSYVWTPKNLDNFLAGLRKGFHPGLITVHQIVHKAHTVWRIIDGQQRLMTLDILYGDDRWEKLDSKIREFILNLHFHVEIYENLTPKDEIDLFLLANAGKPVAPGETRRATYLYSDCFKDTLYIYNAAFCYVPCIKSSKRDANLSDIQQLFIYAVEGKHPDGTKPLDKFCEEYIHDQSVVDQMLEVAGFINQLGLGRKESWVKRKSYYYSLFTSLYCHWKQESVNGQTLDIVRDQLAKLSEAFLEHKGLGDEDQYDRFLKAAHGRNTGINSRIERHRLMTTKVVQYIFPDAVDDIRSVKQVVDVYTRRVPHKPKKD